MLGVNPDQARAANQPDTAKAETYQGDYELPPELWDGWKCFVSTWRQWRIVAGIGGIWYEGIDHQALYACMQMLGIKRKHQAQVFGVVQIMEDEARKLRNQRE